MLVVRLLTSFWNGSKTSVLLVLLQTCGGTFTYPFDYQYYSCYYGGTNSTNSTAPQTLPVPVLPAIPVLLVLLVVLLLQALVVLLVVVALLVLLELQVAPAEPPTEAMGKHRTTNGKGTLVVCAS